MDYGNCMMRNDEDWAGGYVIHSIWCPGALYWMRDCWQRQWLYLLQACVTGWEMCISGEDAQKMEIWNPLLSITWFNAHFELQYKPVSRFICSPVLNDHHQQPQEEGDGCRSLFFLGSDKNDYPVNSTSIGGEAAEGEWILFIICIE